MRLLEKTFVKNGLAYETISRSHDVGLFKLFLRDSAENEPTHVGFEVSIIHKNKEGVFKGVKINPWESLTNNEGFGYDGSKSFFPHDKNLAFEYYYKFCEEVELRKASKLAKSMPTSHSEALSLKSDR